MLFPTTLVGSYPQPDWLIDREKLAGRFPPRVRARELWRIPEAYPRRSAGRCDAGRDRAQEEAGLDIITDGEIRRESYSNRFATALDGVDIDNPGVALDRSGHPNPVPRIVGKIRRKHPVEVDDLIFLRKHTDGQGEDDRSRPLHHEPAGAKRLLQDGRGRGDGLRRRGQRRDQGSVHRRRRLCADRRTLHASAAEKAEAYGLAALNRALEGVAGETIVHICFGYAAIIHQRPSGYSFLGQLKACSCKQVSLETAQSKLDCSALSDLKGKKILLGVLDLADMTVETPEIVAARIRRALPYASPEDIVVAPDCGLKYLPRDVADGKMRAMVAGAAILRREHAGG